MPHRAASVTAEEGCGCGKKNFTTGHDTLLPQRNHDCFHHGYNVSAAAERGSITAGKEKRGDDQEKKAYYRTQGWLNNLLPRSRSC
jgi:hypothetical protein